jgi:hypothetical protein
MFENVVIKMCDCLKYRAILFSPFLIQTLNLADASIIALSALSHFLENTDRQDQLSADW